MLKHVIVVVLVALGCIAGSPAFGAMPQAEISNEQGVKVTVTPPDFAKPGTVWAFEVALETHIHPLGDDLTKVSELIVNGARHAPLDWVGTPPGGHHRKGQLRFKAIEPFPASLELRIHLTGELAPRIFKWSFK